MLLDRLPVVLAHIKAVDADLCGDAVFASLHRIIERFGLEGALKNHLVLTSLPWQELDFALDQVAPSSIKSILEHFP